MYKIIIFSILLCGCSTFRKLKSEIKSATKKKEIIRTIWSKNFDGKFNSGNLPIGLAGAFVDKNFVFAADQDGVFYSFNKETGRIIWKVQSKGRMFSSPVADEDSVYYGTALGRFYSRNKVNGKLNYEIDLGAAIITTPTFFKGRAFLHLNNHKIVCLDQMTGKILWAYTRSIPYSTTIHGASKPVIYNGRMFVGFSDGYLTSFRIEDGVLLWETKIGLNNKFVDVDFKPVIYNNQLYVFSQDEELSVINPNDGQLLRKFEIYPASILKNKQKLMIGTRKGEIVIIDNNLVEQRKKISTSSLNKLLKWNQGYFTSDLSGVIYYLDSNFNIVWSRKLGHAYSSLLGDINLFKKTLAIYTSRQKLYVYQLN